MFKRILLMVLCFCMALSVGSAVLENAMSTVAYESGTSIEEDRNSLNALQNNLSSIQTNKENLQALIDKTNMETQTMLQEKMLLEQEYTLLVDEENAINDIIAEYERIIEQTADDKADAEDALEKQLEDFGAILVYMYINGDQSRLEIFLKSKSYSEYLAYIECMENLLKSSDKMVDDIRCTVDNIATKEADYIEANQGLLDYRETLKDTQADKEQKQKEIEEKIGKNNELLELTQQEIDSMQDDEEALRNQISDLQHQIEDKLAATFNGQFSFPIIGYSGYTITSRFGIRTDGPFTSYEHHNGLDIACPRGTAIGAAEAGIVTFAGYNGSFGNVVFIEHGGGLTSVYAHCDSLLVTAGTKVAKDQVIARVGTTGKSSGYHLHFAVLKNGVYVDPEDYLYA